MNLDNIPEGSLFHNWLTVGRMLETPNSFLLAVGMSALGVILRRNVWVDLGKAGRVYPNISVLLVGPSGLGKDTAINLACRQIIWPFANDLDITGNTIEAIVNQLYSLQNIHMQDPACGYILAAELTSLFGGKDYQKGIVQRLTDLLSTNDRFQDSTKSEGRKVIMNPTVTLIGGTTEEWLHKNMPENALEGGLIPRMLVVAEDKAKRMVPRPNYEMTWEDKRIVDGADAALAECLTDITRMYNTPRELMMTEEAGFEHDNWYCNRYSLFSPTVQPYAHRSRSQISRMAMLSAVSRRSAFVELVDINFAIEMMAEVAKSIDRAILPPNMEYKVGRQLKVLLPRKESDLIKILSPKYDSSMILRALIMLRNSDQIVQKDSLWYNKDGRIDETA